MKALNLSLALAATLGLCSAALADCGGAVDASAPAGCCGHGLLSKLKLHRCGDCAPKCDAPKPCAAPCDPCKHRLSGMLSCVKVHRSCCEKPKCEKSCAPKCEKVCAPKCPKPCAPKCEHACTPKCPKPCKVHVCKPKCEVKCEAKCETKCNACHRLPRLCNKCDAPKPCDPCRRHLSLSRLLGKACNPCEGATAEAPAAAAPAATSPAPKPMGTGANSNGLLILTPAG